MRSALSTLILVAVLIAPVAYTVVRRPRWLKKEAFIVSVTFAAFVALFVAGETFDDPGGWKAVGLVASWLIPLVGLSVVAWRGPQWVRPLFVVLAVAVAAMHVSAAVDPRWWHSIEFARGPIRAIVSFALAMPIAVYGRRAPLFAGSLLVWIGIVPLAMSSFAARSAPMVVLVVPLIVIGALYVLAARVERPST